MQAELSPFVSGHRREFLKTGGLAIGGFSLWQVLRSRSMAEQAGLPRRDTAVIFVTLGGGPSQLETYDPKPLAPVEYRGAFRPISTKLPGVQFCELLPRQAAMIDQLAIVRSIHHEQASHIAEHIVETGYDLKSSANARNGEMPSVGAVVSRVRGANPSGIPSYVSLPRHHAYSGAHWLGAQHHYFAVNDDPNSPTFQVSNLALTPQLTLARLNDRCELRQSLDQQKRLHDLFGQADSLDAISQQAVDLITGKRRSRRSTSTASLPDCGNAMAGTCWGNACCWPADLLRPVCLLSPFAWRVGMIMSNWRPKFASGPRNTIKL